MINIAILLTVHNRKKKTLQCLKNLSEQALPKDYNIQVHLTDDGSTDGTDEAIKKEYPQVNLIKGSGNLFWNRGMLSSWKHAASDSPNYYLWLNDDTILFSDSIKRLLTISHKYGDNSIIVGSTCNDKNILTYGGRKAQRNYPLIAPNNTEPIPCDTFNGNIVLIPHKVFLKVGFNDEYYHHSFGDIDYGLTAKKKGIQNYIAPDYYGICERNNPIPIFRRKCNPLIKRYKLLYSPLGFNPIEDFHLNKKFYPLHQCIWWFCKLHLNVLFPVEHTKF